MEAARDGASVRAIAVIRTKEKEMWRTARHRTILGRLRLAIVLGTVAFVLTPQGDAQVQLVTMPDRDAVELTIYSGVDLTFAKEQRDITLRQGADLIQFGWAGTQIDPTSTQLVSVSDPEGVQVVETILPEHLDNAIQWRVKSVNAGSHAMEVSYFIRGLAWHADYVAFVNARETELRLLGDFLLSNTSGEHYEHAAARLVLGDIHLVLGKESHTLLDDELLLREARSLSVEATARASSLAQGFSAGRVLEVQENVVAPGQALSEYYIYGVQGERTLRNAWTERIRALDVEHVPLSVVYRSDLGNSRVRRLYTLANDAEHELGIEPFPPGNVSVFMADEEGKNSFVGRNRITFTPIGGEVRLDLGPEPAVEVERKQMDYVKTNLAFNDDGDVSHFDTEQEYRIEARNFRSETIRIEVPIGIPGQWEMLRSSHEFQRKGVNAIQFELDVDPGETQVATYRFRTFGR